MTVVADAPKQTMVWNANATVNAIITAMTIITKSV